jgi:hypothetical protein
MAQDAELVVHLGPARHERERALGPVEESAQVLELVEQQQPGVRGQEMGDGLGRRVRAMSRAERIVDVEIRVVRELPGESGVIRRLAGMEARVLDHAKAIVG